MSSFTHDNNDIVFLILFLIDIQTESMGKSLQKKILLSLQTFKELFIGSIRF